MGLRVKMGLKGKGLSSATCCLPSKLVVASDSFKGSLASWEVAEEVEKAVYEVAPECEVVKVAMADGGEGTAEVLVRALEGSWIACPVYDPFMRRVEARYGISGDGRTAVIEMAVASGLTLLAESERNPWLSTSYGTGELIGDALARGCRKFLIGIGGSATNDAGTGMLQALGYQFLNREGERLGTGGRILEEVCFIDSAERLPALDEAFFTVACDVDNPLFGEYGAARVFAAQKGADEKMITMLDRGLTHFADVIARQLGRKIEAVPGAGAAGGMGAAFLAFLSSELKPGVQVVLDAVRFDEKIRGAELIITGEGKIDRQTVRGKTPYGVLQTAVKQNIPAIALAGRIEDPEVVAQMSFRSVHSIHPENFPPEQAMDPEITRQHLRATVKKILLSGEL